jgi:uncharacterized protein
MYADELLVPWLDVLREEVPELEVYDAHTHVGTHDPSGFSATPDELLHSLALCDGRALVFPLTEPDGYREANRRTCELAASSGGRLAALARVTPTQDPVRLLTEALEAGARGVKLHLSSDDFRLDDPRLEGVLEIADDRRLPVMVHAGPELETIGRTVLDLGDRYPQARLILAHCALVDLAWLWREVPSTPHLFLDTSWWSPAHVMSLMARVPPGRILAASDLPYSTPLAGAVAALRCGVQAGLDAAQLRSVAGGQVARLVAGAEPLDLGPAPSAEARSSTPTLEVLVQSLVAALEPMQRGQDPGTPLTVARHACDLSADDPDAPVAASVLRLLDLYEEHRDHLPRRNQFAPGRDLVMTAAMVARTPAAALPR